MYFNRLTERIIRFNYNVLSYEPYITRNHNNGKYLILHNDIYTEVRNTNKLLWKIYHNNINTELYYYDFNPKSNYIIITHVFSCFDMYVSYLLQNGCVLFKIILEKNLGLGAVSNNLQYFVASDIDREWFTIKKVYSNEQFIYAFPYKVDYIFSNDSKYVICIPGHESNYTEKGYIRERSKNKVFIISTETGEIINKFDLIFNE